MRELIEQHEKIRVRLIFIPYMSYLRNKKTNTLDLFVDNLRNIKRHF